MHTRSQTLREQVRLDNFEAALEEVATEFYNVLRWRTTGPQTDDYDALALKEVFKNKIREDLYKQFCQEQQKLFSEKIHYEDGNSNLSATPQYSGNISWVEYQVGNRRKQAFGYQYDALNRLKNSQFAESKIDGTYTTSNKYNESIVYDDARGNIKNLTRFGVTGISNGRYCYGKIDDLTYTYIGKTNKLANVSDIATSGTTKGVINNGGSYDYDEMGNMIKDNSKNLVIKYNYLNLPYEFTFANAGRIYITYSADGSKLRKQVFSASGLRTSDHYYVGNFEYENGVFESAQWSDGRFTKNGSFYRPEFYLKDHLGNNRVTFANLNSDADINGNTEIIQENHFYAFGMSMEGAWNQPKVAGSLKNNYQYNDREWHSDLGLNLNDHGARWYDPAIGRWGCLDPLSEDMVSYSPYNFSFNNPINFADPSGMQGEDWVKPKGGAAYWDSRVNGEGSYIAHYGLNSNYEYLGKQGYGYMNGQPSIFYASNGIAYDLNPTIELPAYTFDQLERDKQYLAKDIPKFADNLAKAESFVIGTAMTFGIGGLAREGIATAEVIGTAQTTGTRGHAFISKLIGYRYALDPRVERVTFDLGYKRLIGQNAGELTFKWGPRPDVGVLFKSGRVKVFEVASRTDDLNWLLMRNSNFMTANKINGSTTVVPIARWINYLFPK